MSYTIGDSGGRDDEGNYFPHNLIKANFTIADINEEDRLNEKKRAFEVVVFILVSFLGFIMNLRVLFIVTDTPRRKLRHVNILVAHLSFVTLFMMIISLLYVVDRFKVMKISGPGICEIFSFIRNAVWGAFPLNIVGIIYERVRTINIALGKFLVYRTLYYTWIAALVGSIPSYFSAEYYIDPATGVGRCKQIAIIDRFEATLIYELARFMAFHFLVAVYMGYGDSCQIIEYFVFSFSEIIHKKPIPNERMRQKVQRIRFIYLNSIIFIVLWVPIGFLLFFYKVLSRIGLTDFSGIGILKSMAHLQYFYSIFNPVIYLYLSENISTLNIFCCCFNFRRHVRNGVIESSLNKSNIQTKRISYKKQKSNIEAEGIEDVTKDKSSGEKNEKYERIPNKIHSTHNIEDHTFGTSEMSRISTVMASTDSSDDSIVEHKVSVVHLVPEAASHSKNQQELDVDEFLKNFKMNVEILI
ncbi:unnamed protein product [Orchesella dallaii]|uniref:G-protein coupled receptors family 1 profile domain-containing protein n=1 Tax=Orchesella dallaii TaxID=48710 RepID=A0ABP1RWH1_9HEXA